MAKKELKRTSNLCFALKQYGNAVEGLATGPEDVRYRLRDVYKSIASVSPNLVPSIDGLKDDVEWILNEMRFRFEGDRWDPTYAEMMQRFQRRTGVKIAERIHKVWCNLCRQMRLERGNEIVHCIENPGLN